MQMSHVYRWSVNTGLAGAVAAVGAVMWLAATPDAHADSGETIPGTDLPIPTTVAEINGDGSQLVSQLDSEEADLGTASDLLKAVGTSGSLSWMNDVTTATNAQFESADPSTFAFAGEERPLLIDQGQFQDEMIKFFDSLQIPSQGETNGLLMGALHDDLNDQDDINNTVVGIDNTDYASQLTQLTEDNLALATFDSDLSNEASWTGDVDLLTGV